MVFDNTDEMVVYFADKYPKSQGKTMASWVISELLLLVAVYEDGDMIHGFFIHRDPVYGYKWTLVDNFHADLAVRNYLEFMAEMQEALEASDLEAILEGAGANATGEDFFEDLDLEQS